MEKKIFVVDKTNGYIPPKLGTPEFEDEQRRKKFGLFSAHKAEKSKEESPIPKVLSPIKVESPSLKKGEWKKMTLKKFILSILQGEPFSTEEIAKKFKEEGHSNKTIDKIKLSVSATISMLRKEGFPIHKIKAGRYGIKTTGE